MRHPELVGADLDPPFFVPGITPSPQGAFGLRLRTGETHDDVYHGFLVLRIGLNPSRGRAGFWVKQKILTALLMGPFGSASSLRAAYRRVGALRAKRCAAHKATLLTGLSRRPTNARCKAAGCGLWPVCTCVGFRGCGVWGRTCSTPTKAAVHVTRVNHARQDARRG